MTSRIGVLGGMFDPIHNGHVQAAVHAYQSLSLSLVKLVPCAIPNHRAVAHSEADHRLAMIEIAIKEQVGLEVDPIELEREGVSYSVDTMRKLSSRTENTDYVFILGIDAFNTLHLWHKWENLFDLCCFFVLARSNVAINEDLAKAINLDERRVNSSDALFRTRGTVYFASDFNCSFSSTEVRNKLNNGADLRRDLNENVVSYIQNNFLYRSPR